MAKEVLAVPEEHLADVIKVIRLGLDVVGFDKGDVHPEVVEQLTKWCDKEDTYLEQLGEE